MTPRFSTHRNLLSLPCLCLGVLLPGPAAGQTQTMNPAALADIRLYLDFSTSTYTDQYPELREEMREGIDFGMRMWQSVLPGLQYQWVSSASQANLQLKFGNYQTTPPGGSCGTQGFTACATKHWNGVLPAGAKIWFNDAGKVLGSGRIPPFTFRQYNHVSRSELFAGYRPATLPPEGYDPSHGGNHVGMYYPAHLSASDDVSLIFFHEFAHVLGMSHDQLTAQELKDWYGNPRSPSGAQPLQPYQQISSSTYPGLPSYYYTRGYFGGGTYNPSTRQTTEAWTGDLDELHPIMYHHHHGAEDLDLSEVPGIPLPPFAKFNNRVVYPGDLGPAMPPYAWSYPKINGLIVLEQPSTGYYFYTSDWSVAIAKAQLDRVGQPDRWFIKDVLTGNALRNKLSVGNDHVLAIRNDGKVYAWGRNDFGQLGQGTISTSITSPVPVTGLSGVFTSVAAGISHSAALRSDGTIWTWGRNSSGELGNNSTQNRSTPVQVCNLSGHNCSGNKYIAIAAGGAHTLALREDGTLWAWGYNGEGQAGQYHAAPVLLPQKEYWGAGDWVAISAGSNHSLGLKAGGPANGQGWGYGHRGQTGLDRLGNAYYPERVWSAQSWRPMALGGGEAHFSLAQNLEGTLWAWGDNSSGQLGRNVSEFGYMATPVTVQGEGGAKNWTQIARGGQHAGGRKDDGRIWTWGDNGSGQLGRGAIATTGVPGEVSGSRTDWSSLFLGGKSSFAFRKDGTLWSWGNNQYGQLGNGTTTPSNTPVAAKFGDLPFLNLYADWTDHHSQPAQAIAPQELTLLRVQNTAGTGFVPITFNLKSSAYGNFPQVDFRNGTSLLFSDNTAPFGGTWTAPSAGRFSLNARVVDRMNTAVASPNLIVNIFQQGVKFRSPPTTSVNLPTEGAMDWMHWGLIRTDRVEKASPSVAITMTPTTFPVERFSSTLSTVPGFYWNNGTAHNPTEVGQSRTGVFLTSGESYMFRIPATTSVRTVQIWFRVRNAKFGITSWHEDPALVSQNHAGPAAFSTTSQYLICETTFARASGTGYFNLQIYPHEFGPGGGDMAVQAIALK